MHDHLFQNIIIIIEEYEANSITFSTNCLEEEWI
ncbi:aminotransferase [Lysinibacillus boronitolerans JCM 21713 = 10a = NBRC 103108]|uniref:Aminotransferase n=1 Tax=Lysinibacillus boronitolerans JCM 21713 = 10a = NBRC 103108 TaxID=1294264 RepID=A0ABR4XZY6_9BACI|nr:aminotransferase [Lysinibacillus boronitolerans JCM 21713 = 10a = NBRC 103108]